MPLKRKASSASSKAAASKKLQRSDATEVPTSEELPLTDEAIIVSSPLPTPAKPTLRAEEEEDDCRFIGEPVSDDEARRRWPHRYQGKGKGKEVAGSKSWKP
ncbi:DNA (cytosine-5-)-methyltransferase [Sarracenia purpurea var. burkii]